MAEDLGVDELVRQWTAERSADRELVEANELASAWLAESSPGIPTQAGPADGQRAGAVAVDEVDPAYLVVMRRRLPGVPEDLMIAAAKCWQMVGSISDAQQWWDAGLSPLDQRALEYRAAGLSPEDLGKHLGPYTVLEHLRRGSAPEWCVARLRRQRRDGVA
ncbi:MULTISPECIES: hypothetical protein [Sciscionella]|uniref:hypothetical protein n=1 Tax=Sciscionella TaxID=596495 RepID=UPI0003630CDE|nr:MULTISPECIES: hypothetical protein [Sciscionella]